MFNTCTLQQHFAFLNSYLKGNLHISKRLDDTDLEAGKQLFLERKFQIVFSIQLSNLSNSKSIRKIVAMVSVSDQICNCHLYFNFLSNNLLVVLCENL